MNTITTSSTSNSNSPAPRRWRKWALVIAVFVAVAGLVWWLFAGNTGGAAVTAQVQQPAGQGTGDAASSVSGQLNQTGAVSAAGQPITATLDLPGGPPRGRPGVVDNAVPAGAPAAASTPVATPTSTADAALASGIIAVAGRGGADLQPLDASAPVRVKAGVRLTLLARSADDRWLLATSDAATGWVAADAVIAFNTARLPVTAAATPGAAMTTTVDVVAAVSAATTTSAAVDTGATAGADTAAATAASSAAPITARINRAETSGLNVRAGPGTAYAMRGALGSGDVVTVVGRTADGVWLEVVAAQLDGGSGWASAYYLLVDGDSDSLPVTASATMTDAGVAAVLLFTSAASESSADASTVAPTATPISQSRNLPISNAAAPGLSGTLVFQSSQGGAIYAYALDTGSLWTLTSGFDPAISPDGQTVAFTRQGVDGGLYLIDIDGSDERRIYTGPLNIASPKWSEDGSRIAFSYVASSLECRDMGPGRCIPDSELLAGPLADVDPNDYPLITKYDYDLGVVAADGSDFHSLAALHSSRAPDWSAAGIVYQSTDGIQVIQDEPGASSQVIVYDMLQPAYQDPDWQPGGRRILFQRQGASHWEIWAVDADGSDMVALTQPRTTLVDALPSNVAPAWSPDGSKVVFLSNREADGEAGAWRLWVMDADGGNQQQLPIDVAVNYTFGAEQMVSWGQ